MPDLPAHLPDVLNQLQQEKQVVIICEWAESPLLLSPKIWRVVVDSNKRCNIILNKNLSQKQREILNYQVWVEKLRKLPDYEWSKVQKAIEKWTIEIMKIPNRDIFAIYESKSGNLVYLVNLDGSNYSNIDWARKIPEFEALIIWWFIKQWYRAEVEDWLLKLYWKNGKEIPIFSTDYATATLNAINHTAKEIDAYAKDMEFFKEKYKIENLPKLLSNETERAFLKSDIKVVLWWILNEDNSITVWNNTFKPWTKEYITLMDRAIKHWLETTLILLKYSHEEKLE